MAIQPLSTYLSKTVDTRTQTMPHADVRSFAALPMGSWMASRLLAIEKAALLTNQVLMSRTHGGQDSEQYVAWALGDECVCRNRCTIKFEPRMDCM